MLTGHDCLRKPPSHGSASVKPEPYCYATAWQVLLGTFASQTTFCAPEVNYSCADSIFVRRFQTIKGASFPSCDEEEWQHRLKLHDGLFATKVLSLLLVVVQTLQKLKFNVLVQVGPALSQHGKSEFTDHLKFHGNHNSISHIIMLIYLLCS